MHSWTLRENDRILGIRRIQLCNLTHIPAIRMWFEWNHLGSVISSWILSEPRSVRVFLQAERLSGSKRWITLTSSAPRCLTAHISILSVCRMLTLFSNGVYVHLTNGNFTTTRRQVKHFNSSYRLFQMNTIKCLEKTNILFASNRIFVCNQTTRICSKSSGYFFLWHVTQFTDVTSITDHQHWLHHCRYTENLSASLPEKSPHCFIESLLGVSKM